MAKRPENTDTGAASTGTEEAKPTGAKRAYPPRDQRDYKGVMARINREGWKALNNLSTDLDRPLQRMLVEAMNDYLTKHGRDPVVETRAVPKD